MRNTPPWVDSASDLSQGEGTTVILNRKQHSAATSTVILYQDNNISLQ